MNITGMEIKRTMLLRDLPSYPATAWQRFTAGTPSLESSIVCGAVGNVPVIVARHVCPWGFAPEEADFLTRLLAPYAAHVIWCPSVVYSSSADAADFAGLADVLDASTIALSVVDQDRKSTRLNSSH